jgi:hypothetical protein
MQGVNAGKALSEGTFKFDEAFWDGYQANGARTDYSQAFSGGYFDDNTFKPKYKLNVTNAWNMFKTAINITDLSNVEMDFSQCSNFDTAFSAMTALTKIGDISTVGAELVKRPFLQCTSLAEVGIFTVKKETEFDVPFAQCINLEQITFAGVIGNNLNIRWSPLNKASIESIIECLSPDVTGKTLTLKRTAKEAAFTEDEWVALITPKSNDYDGTWTITLL